MCLKGAIPIVTPRRTQWPDIWDDWRRSVWLNLWRRLNPKYRATSTLIFIARFEHLKYHSSDAKSRLAGSENDMAGSNIINYFQEGRRVPIVLKFLQQQGLQDAESHRSCAALPWPRQSPSERNPLRSIRCIRHAASTSRPRRAWRH